MKRQRPDMNFAVQDVTDMSDFAEDQEYTVALDKGECKQSNDLQVGRKAVFPFSQAPWMPCLLELRTPPWSTRCSVK